MKPTFKREDTDRSETNYKGQRGGWSSNHKTLRPEDMFCVLHRKGIGHIKICPKINKNIKEAQEEAKSTS